MSLSENRLPLFHSASKTRVNAPMDMRLASSCVRSGAMMGLTLEALYVQLGHLLTEIPDLAEGAITAETERWLERAVSLVESSGSLADALQLGVAAGNLSGPLRARNAETIAEIVRRALAKAEPEAPATTQGMFTIAKDPFEALVAVRKILIGAASEVLLVDPHADAKALTDVAVLVREQVVVRLLADEIAYRKSLASAAQRWLRQFGTARPLFVRLAPAGALRDILILVDGVAAWALRQPFSRITRCSYLSLVRIPPDAASAMIAAHAARWDAAEPMFAE